ncbi:MAG: DUF6588 family protein [Longimicrobiales bacterium]
MRINNPMTVQRQARCLRGCAALLVLLALPRPAASQSIEDVAGSYIGANANGYFGPLAQVLTASLNSGFIGPVPPTHGFSIRIGAVVPSMIIGDGQRTFTATTGEGFRPAKTVQAPTIMGSATPLVVEGEGGSGFILPAGMDISRVSLAVPQITIGGIAGTEATIRWLGISTNEELGKLKLGGLGVRQNLAPFLPDLPVDLALGVMYNKLELGTTLDVAAKLITLQASRHVGWFDLYGGLGYEDATAKLRYDNVAAESGQVEVDLEGVKGLRGTGGFALQLPLIALRADLTLGSQTVVGLGLSLGTRY